MLNIKFFTEFQRHYLIDLQASLHLLFKMSEESTCHCAVCEIVNGGSFCTVASDDMGCCIYLAPQGGFIAFGWIKDRMMMAVDCKNGTLSIIFKNERIDDDNGGLRQ